MTFARCKCGFWFQLPLFLLFACTTTSGQLARPLASISGTVKDTQGRALGGVTVVLSSSPAGAAVLRTVTDAEGDFVLHNLNYGTYILSVELTGGSHAEPKEVRVESPTIRADLTVAVSAALAGAGGLKSTESLEQAPPAFIPSGVHGTIAPSGYSTGLSSEETAQVLNRVNDLDADLDSAYLPVGTDVGCGKEADLVAAAKANPKSVSANRALGLFYLVHGERAKSIHYLNLSYAAEPDDSGNARDLAFAMIMAGQYADAIPILESAAAKNNTNPIILRLLALSYGALGDLQKSAAEYKRASTLDSSVGNLFLCGVGLIDLGESGDAEQLFSAATHTNPRSAKLWTGLGIAQDIRQQKKEAILSLLRAVDLDPEYIPPYSFLAGLSGVSTDADSGIRKRLAALVVAKPDSAEAHYDYALALWKERAVGAPEGSVSEIQSQLRMAIEQDPAMVRAHFQLGVVFAESGNYADAITEFQEAVKLEPGSAEGHYRLAQAYRHEQMTEQASLEMKRFLELHGSQGAGSDTPESDLQRIVLQQNHWKASAGPCPFTAN